MSMPAGRSTTRGSRELSAVDAIDLIRRHGGSSVVFQSAGECLDHPQASALELGDTLATASRGASRRGVTHRVAPRAADPERPLAGIRVVDFGVGGVGPFSATFSAGSAQTSSRSRRRTSSSSPSGPRSAGSVRRTSR